MPVRPTPSSIDAIVQRAQQMELHVDAIDPQLLAAVREGSISLDSLPEPLLEACREALGTSGLVDLLLEDDEEQEQELPQPLRPSFGWRNPGAWMSLAAAVAIVAGVGFAVLKVRSGNGREVGSMASALSQPFQPEKIATSAIPLSRGRLAAGLPNFDDPTATLGVTSDAQKQSWRLATAIIRTPQGFGSGAFIDPAGWLLTNYHVVAEPVQTAALRGEIGQVQVICAQLSGHQVQPADAVSATVFRADPIHDLALLKLDAMPGGTASVHSFPLAKTIEADGDCTVVGSQFNGPAWWVRGGNISQQFNYPQDLSQFAAGIGTQQMIFDRERIPVIVSDTRISPGDSGGPLLNDKGELIGLTYATSANPSAGSVGWHIALPAIRQFIANLPQTPEAVPLDFWTGGYAEPDLLLPRPLNANAVQYRFGGANQQTIAQVRYIRLHPSATPLVERINSTADLPRGIWAAPADAAFDFDLCLLERDDQVVALGYTNGSGQLLEIRIGRTGSEWAEVIWTRDDQNLWHAERPSVRVPLFDENRFDATQKHQLAITLRADGSSESGAVSASGERQTSQRIK